MTTMGRIDSLILGHNPFIGVDHLSQERARSRLERGQRPDQVAELVAYCGELGVKGLMLSTHPRAREILEPLASHGLTDLSLYPLIPYAQGYVRALNQKGVIGTVNEVLGKASLPEKLRLFMKGGTGLLRRDLYDIMPILIDVELLAFKGWNVKAVFLHNLVTDLALAWGAREAFELFSRHIEERYHAIPGFCTMNLPRLVRTLKSWGIQQPLVMASFNKVGFQMNPSREEYERCLAEGGVEVLAMSTLASGYLQPEEAFQYLGRLPGINSVVVGVSTRAHAEATFGIIKKYLGSGVVSG